MQIIRYILPGFALCAHLAAVAQNPGCDGFRYKQQIFSTVKKTTVPYAIATSHTGQALTLSMDVYEPQGDTLGKRPVVVLEHGGSFIFGDKADMARWCQLLAQRGYVAASIQYRLYPVFILGFPDSVDIMDAAVKAVGDMKAAVRYFRQDAATQNLFRADPNHVFVGGYSAGAVAALHAAYLDADDNLPAFLQNILTANGGLNGNSGSAANQSYSSAVEAVINLSGGLYRREWINDGDLPVSSIHGTADETVKFYSGLAANLAYLEGSGLLHAQAQSVGTWSYLKKIPGAGHTNLYEVPQYAAQVENYWMRTTALLEFLSCYVDTLPEIVTGVVENPLQEPAEWAVYPNPLRDDVCTIRLAAGAPEPAAAVFYDIGGREVMRVNGIHPGEQHVSVAGLAPGLYALRIAGARPGEAGEPGVRKLVRM
ncbi:MAG: alpha/beta hydrolase [Saprospirales bacterium]|nr:alpha/beta hydrolase [Saprospirales bacterium]MBK8923024.1 alpha/beta hydrolase [Saprospirales bacterium]